MMNLTDNRNSTVEGYADTPWILSPMATQFLVVLVLALVNAILGLIYAYIRYRERKRSPYGNTVTLLRRRSSVMEAVTTRRKLSTHMFFSMGQSKESARRLSTAFL